MNAVDHRLEDWIPPDTNLSCRHCIKAAKVKVWMSGVEMSNGEVHKFFILKRKRFFVFFLVGKLVK